MKYHVSFGLGLLLIVSLTLVGCSGISGASAVEPSSVTFDVELIEIKGSTDGIAPPDTDPTSLSQGYRFKPPGEYDADNPDKWEVSTYMFSPGAMSVFQGDEVTLRMFGINGDEHTMTVFAPDGSVVESFSLNRGRETEVTFVANQVGYYLLVCGNHSPTMQAPIQVIPTG